MDNDSNTRLPGDIFRTNDKYYQVIDVASWLSCRDCAFYQEGCLQPESDRHRGCCSQFTRPDHRNVIFKELKKVGVPFLLYGVPMQRYWLIVTPTASAMSEFHCRLSFTNDSQYIDIEIMNNPNRFDTIKHIRPFDLDKAANGKPLCTRDGREARFIGAAKVYIDTCETDTYLVAATYRNPDGAKTMAFYTAEGRLHPDRESDLDLQLIEEDAVGWVNVYRTPDGGYEASTVFPSREEAEENITATELYAGTTQIQWNDE